MDKDPNYQLFSFVAEELRPLMPYLVRLAQLPEDRRRMIGDMLRIALDVAERPEEGPIPRGR